MVPVIVTGHTLRELATWSIGWTFAVLFVATAGYVLARTAEWPRPAFGGLTRNATGIALEAIGRSVSEEVTEL